MEEPTNQVQPEEQPEEQPQAQPEPQPELQAVFNPAAISSGLPTLRFGDTGNSVRALQRILVSNGYFVQVDGVYGALTEAAVKAFQSARGLSADGVVGPRTWGVLTG
ncbi:peptidoglycan-binding domain-containing protein [Mastigocladopsis repens]|uniref:peptidoglycan-binding domain-containing protein n=1 Tax=Mastigocladopsis repens TaxID=221287 RepID=UPI00031499A9|nr:peptidoglycan-binding domain-containing protein [Mastigocladopsis repens]